MPTLTLQGDSTVEERPAPGVLRNGYDLQQVRLSEADFDDLVEVAKCIESDGQAVTYAGAIKHAIHCHAFFLRYGANFVEARTGLCWCGCGEETKGGRHFVHNHDATAYSRLCKVYGGLANVLASLGFASEAESSIKKVLEDRSAED